MTPAGHATAWCTTSPDYNVMSCTCACTSSSVPVGIQQAMRSKHWKIWLAAIVKEIRGEFLMLKMRGVLAKAIFAIVTDYVTIVR